MKLITPRPKIQKGKDLVEVATAGDLLIRQETKRREQLAAQLERPRTGNKEAARRLRQMERKASKAQAKLATRAASAS